MRAIADRYDLPEDRFAGVEAAKANDIEYKVRFLMPDGRYVSALNTAAFFTDQFAFECRFVEGCTDVDAAEYLEALNVNGDYLLELFPVAVPLGAVGIDVRSTTPGGRTATPLHSVEFDRIEASRFFPASGPDFGSE